jgi:hypothetical protein
VNFNFTLPFFKKFFDVSNWKLPNFKQKLWNPIWRERNLGFSQRYCWNEVFRDMSLCPLVSCYRSFEGTWPICSMLEYLLTEDEGNSLFRNVGSYLPVEKSYAFRKTWNFKHLLQFYVETIVTCCYVCIQYVPY